MLTPGAVMSLHRFQTVPSSVSPVRNTKSSMSEKAQLVSDTVPALMFSMRPRARVPSALMLMLSHSMLDEALVKLNRLKLVLTASLLPLFPPVSRMNSTLLESRKSTAMEAVPNSWNP